MRPETTSEADHPYGWEAKLDELDTPEMREVVTGQLAAWEDQVDDLQEGVEDLPDPTREPLLERLADIEAGLERGRTDIEEVQGAQGEELDKVRETLADRLESLEDRMDRLATEVPDEAKR